LGEIAGSLTAQQNSGVAFYESEIRPAGSAAAALPSGQGNADTRTKRRSE
jgi:hypothetical protein